MTVVSDVEFLDVTNLKTTRALVNLSYNMAAGPPFNPKSMIARSHLKDTKELPF